MFTLQEFRQYSLLEPLSAFGHCLNMKTSLGLVTSALFLAGCSASDPTPPADIPPAAPAPVQKSASELTPMERGQRIYARCRACHTLEQDGKHKVGPNLWNVYGSEAGTKEGFAYSKAMKASDIIWDTETMDAYLTRPSAYMPGNKMVFVGLKKQEDRDAVQAFMRSQTTP